VSFLAPVRAGSGMLEVEGRALRVGRQVAFAEAHARTSDGKIVGHATTSLALVRR
jgi:acyl-coenzyme A thioesterase PaaI-like protein